MNIEKTNQKTQKVHHGRNIKRFREMLSIKQETLAETLETNQQQISKLELQEIIKDESSKN